MSTGKKHAAGRKAGDESPAKKKKKITPSARVQTQCLPLKPYINPDSQGFPTRLDICRVDFTEKNNDEMQSLPVIRRHQLQSKDDSPLRYLWCYVGARAGATKGDNEGGKEVSSSATTIPYYLIGEEKVVNIVEGRRYAFSRREKHQDQQPVPNSDPLDQDQAKDLLGNFVNPLMIVNKWYGEIASLIIDCDFDIDKLVIPSLPDFATEQFASKRKKIHRKPAAPIRNASEASVPSEASIASQPKTATVSTVLALHDIIKQNFASNEDLSAARRALQTELASKAELVTIQEALSMRDDFDLLQDRVIGAATNIFASNEALLSLERRLITLQKSLMSKFDLNTAQQTVAMESELLKLKVTVLSKLEPVTHMLTEFDAIKAKITKADALQSRLTELERLIVNMQQAPPGYIDLTKTSAPNSGRPIKRRADVLGPIGLRGHDYTHIDDIISDGDDDDSASEDSRIA